MKNKIISICVVILAFSISTVAQKTFELEDYVSNKVGDNWQYKNLSTDGLSPILVSVSEKRDFNGTEVFKRDENNGDYRLQTLDKKGLKIHQLYFTGDKVVEYEKPVRLMPAKLKSGGVYRSKSDYKYLEKGEVKDTGTQTYAVKVIGTEDITIGGTTYEDCLLMTTKALRTDESGTKSGYLLREWYANGIGLIKVIGTVYRDDKEGKRTKTFYISSEMEKAKVDGKEIDLTK